MIVTLKIFYSEKEYIPSVYFCSWQAAWQLWFTLTRAMKRTESGPFVLKVEIWDGGIKMEPEKGLTCSMNQQI